MYLETNANCGLKWIFSDSLDLGNGEAFISPVYTWNVCRIDDCSRIRRIESIPLIGVCSFAWRFIALRTQLDSRHLRSPEIGSMASRINRLRSAFSVMAYAMESKPVRLLHLACTLRHCYCACAARKHRTAELPGLSDLAFRQFAQRERWWAEDFAEDFMNNPFDDAQPPKRQSPAARFRRNGAEH